MRSERRRRSALIKNRLKAKVARWGGVILDDGSVDEQRVAEIVWKRNDREQKGRKRMWKGIVNDKHPTPRTENHQP